MAEAKATPLRALAIFGLAAVIGAGGGMFGAWFQRLLTAIQHLLIGEGDDIAAAVERLPAWRTVLMPTLGGLLAGTLLLLLRHKKPPFGISDIMVLVTRRRGSIRVGESALQTLSSACTIGSGGSIGREGANVQIGATIAALLGNLFKVNSRSRSMLLGCGVAAGMAGAYNAPIAGAIFVMEVLLGNFAMDVFAPIVMSSVVATLMREAIIDDRTVYELGVLEKLPWNLVFASLLLGVICGFGGVLFRHVLALGKSTFKRWALTPPLALAIGGLCVGLIGLWVPQAWGNGKEVIIALANKNAVDPAWTLVLALVVWKVIATTCTVGSGALGGVFTPNLVVGAAFGSFFAIALHWLQGGSDPVALHHEQIIFTFVGMAGLCAASTHAPITSVMLIFEMTGHYELTLPIMLCSITASLIAKLIDADSYYTAAARAKGAELSDSFEEMAIRSTYVRDVMRKELLTVPDTASFDKVLDILANHRSDTIYVVGQDDGHLVGSIQLHDVKNFINDPTLSSVVIAGDLTRPIAAVTPEDSLAAVMTRFDDPDLTELAVVAPGSTRRLLGRVTRQDVLTGIGEEVLGQQRRNRFRSADGRKIALELPPGYVMATVPVPDEWHGLALDAVPAKDLAGITPVLLQHKGAAGGEVRLPARSEQVLQAGWEMVVVAEEAALQRWQRGERPED